MPSISDFDTLQETLGENYLDFFEVMNSTFEIGEEVLHIYHIPQEPPSKANDYYILTKKRLFRLEIDPSLKFRSSMTCYYMRLFDSIVFKATQQGGHRINLKNSDGKISIDFRADDLRDLYKDLNKVMETY
ncbi:MAG: hypothetical protein P9L92_19390 [Candidatus Electryonea clarkiae]|nr:hypothetical protein [Candidatus Electryonea clarkiae]MDP8285218.1 hypothetical protein [Candidatus Electryonea clarkiae]